MTTTNYGIADEYGTDYTVGLSPEVEARRVAQRLADRHRKPVYLYEIGSEDEPEEIVPETITYCYVAAGEQRSAEHTCTTECAIAAAVSHLDAIEHDGGYAYRAEETGSWYAVVADDMAEFGAAVLAGRATEAYSLWCAGCGAEIEDPTGQTVRCACGEWSGVRCQWSGPREETVVVEYMPDHLRSSHEAAGNRGNRGAYPHNGARRIRVDRSCAEAMVRDDGDWCEVIA